LEPSFSSDVFTLNANPKENLMNKIKDEKQKIENKQITQTKNRYKTKYHKSKIQEGNKKMIAEQEKKEKNYHHIEYNENNNVIIGSSILDKKEKSLQKDYAEKKIDLNQNV